MMKNGKMKKKPASVLELDIAIMKNPIIAITTPRKMSRSERRNFQSHTV
jgi:hypothetical protein